MKNKQRNYQIQTRLGSGSYGVIFKAINRISKQVCVLKQIRMNKMSEKAKKSTLNEATIMGKLIHPFIVQYKQSFIEEDTLHIVMQYCDGGDLSMYLKMQNKKPLKEQKIWRFFLQICVGLQYIHKNKILHRDIKTLNIFLNKNEEIKIGDLGVAKMLMSNDFAQTIVGTPFYLSPELCEEKPYNEKSDIWAMGCLLYELCTFKHPFEAANQASLILKIIRGKYSPIPEFYSKQLKDVIDMCLDRDYKRRPTATMLLQRSKIKQFISEFKFQQKIKDQYQKIKAFKESQQIQPVQNQNIQSKVPVVNSKQLEKKQVYSQEKNVPIVKKQTSVKKIIPEAQIKQSPSQKNNLNQREKKPSISGMPENNIFLPDKNNLIEKLKSNNLIPPKNIKAQVNLPSSQQNQRKIQQSKQDFLKNLEKVVNQNVQQKRSPIRQKPKQTQQIQTSIIFEQKSRLQKIDLKIQEQIQRQKEIQKEKIQSVKRKSETPALVSPKVFQKASLKGDHKSVPFLLPKDNNKDIIKYQSKQNENMFMPPLPPKKQQIIKVKMQQPQVQPKVMDFNKVSQQKNKGIIKSRGFSQEIQDQVIASAKVNARRISDFKRSSQQDVQRPVLFGLDQQEKDKKLNNNGSQKKGINQGIPKASQYHSERNIKLINQTVGISSRVEIKKQPQRYIFKKKPQIIANNSSSRVRKGSSNELSRNAKNLSKNNDVTKQDENDVMNLPDSLNQNIVDSSDQQNQQKRQIKINKNFMLKDINNEMVLQKYEEILSSKSIGNTQILIKSRKKQDQNQDFYQQQTEKCDTVNLKSRKTFGEENFKKQSQRIPLTQQKVLDADIDEMFNKNDSVCKKSVNQLEFIPQNQSLAFKTHLYDDQNDQILDESQEMIESEEKQIEYYQPHNIEEEILQVNNFNLDEQHQYQDEYKGISGQQDYFQQNQQLTEHPTQSEWSFDEDPQLPMLQDKESPYFEEANPYLVPQQEQQTIQQKRKYLQIRLSQNMKRQDEINKLMQIKIEQCKAVVPKYFDEILQFFRKKINKDDQYTENDERQVEQFLRKKGLTDQRKFQNIYKIMHFEMELENTRKIIQRICKKLSQLDNRQQDN